VVVCLELIEHLHDYGGFVASLSRWAPRAILSTPNKRGEALRAVARTPAFEHHVREWTAGEFYWVLRAFYRQVELYTLPRQAQQLRRAARDPAYRPILAPCGPLSTGESLLAVCSDARG